MFWAENTNEANMHMDREHSLELKMHLNGLSPQLKCTEHALLKAVSFQVCVLA